MHFIFNIQRLSYLNCCVIVVFLLFPINLDLDQSNQSLSITYQTVYAQKRDSIPNKNSVQNHFKFKPKITTKASVETRYVAKGKVKVETFMQGRNAFVGRLTLAPLQKVPLHQDPTEEYLYIMEGKGKITIDGKQYTVETGDSIYMPAKAKVSFINGKKTLIALQIFAGPESAQKYQKWPLAKKQ
jgi:quercetin dioxygenase-like cupin family protein